MNLSEAIDHASTLFMPEFLFGMDESMIEGERAVNEEALHLLGHSSQRPTLDRLHHNHGLAMFDTQVITRFGLDSGAFPVQIVDL